MLSGSWLSLNDAFPKLVTVVGIVTLGILFLKNAKSPILFKPSFRVNEDMLFSLKVEYPIVSNELGVFTLVILLL